MAQGTPVHVSVGVCCNKHSCISLLLFDQIVILRAVETSLVPRPDPPKKEGLVSTVCACAQFPRNLGKIVDYRVISVQP